MAATNSKGIPDNPFRKLRLAEGLSQYDLAKRTGLSKHAILRLEQGCFAEPLPTVINYFTESHTRSRKPVSRSFLIDAYRDFQYYTRRKNAGCLGYNLMLILPTCPVGIHPLTYLREGHGINPTALSKLLCISQSTIVYFEKRSLNQATVPQQLISALHDAEYSEEETDLLAKKYNEYRAWLRADKNLRLVHNTDTDTDTSNTKESASV